MVNICPKSSHFCDPGIDDTMALLLAFFIDEIEIVGIVADYGNVPKMAVENAHFLITKQRIEISRYSVVQNVPLQVPHLRFYGCTWETGARSIIPKVNVTNGEMENFLKSFLLLNSIKMN